jgi:hypothetical protein
MIFLLLNLAFSLSWLDSFKAKVETNDSGLQCNLAEVTKYRGHFTKDYLFVVTHPQGKDFDVNFSSYRGLMQTYNWLKRYDMDSVILVENESLEGYFVPTCQPTAFVQSQAGEVDFTYSASTVVLAGGFFSACLRQTLKDLLSNWRPLHSKQNLRILFIMPAIYESLRPYDATPYQEASYFEDLESYKKISGSDKMNLWQVSNVLGAEAFTDRMQAYFKDTIVVGGIGNSNIVYPIGYNIRLNILSHEPSIDTYRMLLQIGHDHPTIELNVIDGAYLRGFIN